MNASPPMPQCDNPSSYTNRAQKLKENHNIFPSCFGCYLYQALSSKARSNLARSKVWKEGIAYSQRNLILVIFLASKIYK